MDLGLKDKRGIISGASRGIGKAVARELAAEGCRVIITARNHAPLVAAATEIASESGAEVHAITCDTSSDQSVQDMVTEAIALLGGLDVLVNCAAQPAGRPPSVKLAALTADVVWPALNVKVLGYMRCIRAAAPYMADGEGGRIDGTRGKSDALQGRRSGRPSSGGSRGYMRGYIRKIQRK
jgi:NAD(P)-dependent dehydrogenase (short-subunit alcohol dehydrogenase family)